MGNKFLIDEISKEDLDKLVAIYDQALAQFKHKGYYSLGNDMIILIEPDVTSVFTNRSYIVDIIAISGRLIKEGASFSTGRRSVPAVDIERELLSLQEDVGVKQITAEHAETLRLLYSAQSTESTVEAESDLTVSGSDQGGKNDK